jgi:hypothetical protein
VYKPVTYSTKLITLDRRLLLIPAAEAALIDKLGQFLLHHLLDLGNGLIQALFCRAGNVEIQGRVLRTMRQSDSYKAGPRKHTAGVAIFLSG